ncbi:MAG: hypothetical protein HYT79_06945 [Elusimicrobia bacterium]|nr:hypothetical protein [Elusimicrobiota bacterium]
MRQSLLMALLCCSLSPLAHSSGRSGAATSASILSREDVIQLHGLARQAMENDRDVRMNQRNGKATYSISRNLGVYNPDGRAGYVGFKVRLDVRGQTLKGGFHPEVFVLHLRVNEHPAGAQGMRSEWHYFSAADDSYLRGHHTGRIRMGDEVEVVRHRLTPRSLSASVATAQGVRASCRFILSSLSKWPKKLAFPITNIVLRR